MLEDPHALAASDMLPYKSPALVPLVVSCQASSCPPEVAALRHLLGDRNVGGSSVSPGNFGDCVAELDSLLSGWSFKRFIK